MRLFYRFLNVNRQTIFPSKMAFFSKARRERFRKRKIRRALAAFALYQLECTTRKWWVHPLNEDRKEKSEYYNMTLDLRKFDDRFFGMYRLHVNQFDQLLEILKPELEKMHTNYREVLSAEERLIITLT